MTDMDPGTNYQQMRELTLKHACKIITLVIQKSNPKTSQQKWKSHGNYNL